MGSGLSQQCTAWISTAAIAIAAHGGEIQATKVLGEPSIKEVEG